MSNLVRVLSDNGFAMACAVNGTAIASEIEKIHQTSATVTAALGRLSIAASIIGFMQKGTDDSITLRLNGNGPSGSLIAVSNSKGNVKAYVQNPIVELPLNQYGKLDVKGAVGTDGFLTVIKDIGLKEPYIGQSPIVSGEIAEDITSYYATSEQIPTVCGLGVLVNPDLTVKAAGGYLVQLLPFADEETIAVIEENIKNIQPISSMIDEGMSPLAVCELLLKGLSPHVLEEAEVAYKCDCNKSKTEKALISLGKKELTKIIEEQGGCQIECHFCNKKYQFSKDELLSIINSQ